MTKRYLTSKGKGNTLIAMKNLIVDRSKTALVVIDLQKGIVGRRTATYASDFLVKNAAALAEAFRKNGMPVLFGQGCPISGR